MRPSISGSELGQRTNRDDARHVTLSWAIIRWPSPLTVCTDNQYISYSCPRERLHRCCFSRRQFVSKLGSWYGTDGQTGRARRAMRPSYMHTGRVRSKVVRKPVNADVSNVSL